MCVCVNIFKHLLWNHSANWSFLGTGERKFVQTVQVTWPRWPSCPYMVKTLKNLLLRNQKADDLGTWYAALGARVLPSLFKWWPWIDLDIFYGKVKFAAILLWYGWKVKQWMFQKLVWFETTTDNPSDEAFLLTSKFLSPQDCMPPALGLYTCIKSKNKKKQYKIRLQRHFCETCNKWV